MCTSTIPQFKQKFFFITILCKIMQQNHRAYGGEKGLGAQYSKMSSVTR